MLFINKDLKRKRKYSISLLHPFSAKAIGLKETDLYYLHSKPHENALRVLQEEGNQVYIDYFTGNLCPYKKNINGICKRFWPITSPIFKKRHGWRKQFSWYHYQFNHFKASDVNIINMSGHGSPYVFNLAKLLVSKRKPYIAMLGGMHISTDNVTMDYYRHAHHIIVHTNIQKEALLKYPEFSNLQIQVIPLGVDTLIFKPNDLRKKERCTLLYVGRISKLKQIELAIEAVAYLKSHGVNMLHLNIIGPSSDLNYLAELKTQVNTLNIDHLVTFVGTKAQQDLIPYYQESDILLLPSSHESFGMVMVEAMACGTPVVALKGAGGPDEIIEHDENGLLCSKDNFKHNVLKLVKDRLFLRKLSENAVHIVHEKWSLNYTIQCFKDSVLKVFN